MPNPENQARGRRNRRKGKDAQREYARYNCALWNVDPSSHALWDQSHPDNVYLECPGEGWFVEVKHEQDWEFPLYVRETERGAITWGLQEVPDDQSRWWTREWWVAARRPTRKLRETWYVLTGLWTFTRTLAAAFTFVEGVDSPLFHSLEGVLTWWDDHLPLVPDAEVLHKEGVSRWSLERWIMETEAKACPRGSARPEVPWWWVNVGPPRDHPDWKYLQGAYTLCSGRLWAHLLGLVWSDRQEAAQHEETDAR